MLFRSGGTSVYTIGGLAVSITNSLQYMVRTKSAYQHLYSTACDDAGVSSSYVATIVEYVEYESYDPVPSNRHMQHIPNLEDWEPQ